MTKGSYSIGESSPSNHSRNNAEKDNSFSSFICALLIFLAICLIIFLAAFNWKSVTGATDDSKKESLSSQQDNNYKNDDNVEDFSNKKNKSGEKEAKFEKIVVVKVEEPIETNAPTTTFKPPTATSNLLQIWINTKIPYIVTKRVDTTTSTNVFTTTSTPAIFVSNSTKEVKTTKSTPVIFVTNTTKEVKTTKSTPLIFVTNTTKFEVKTTTPNNDYDAIFVSNTTKEVKTTKSTPVIFVTNTTKFEVKTTTPNNDYDVYDEQERQKEKVSEDEQTTTEDVVRKNLNSETSSTVNTETIIESTTENAETTTIATKEFNFSSSESTINILTRIVNSPANLTTTIRPVTPATSTIPPNKEKEEVTLEEEFLTQVTPQIVESSSWPTSPSPRPRVTFTSSILFKKTPEPVCRSSACNTAASRILSLMNHSSNPCEDFYVYACGGMASNTESADSSDADMLSTQLNAVHNSSPKYLKDFRKFYRTCMEHEDYFKYQERIRGLRELLMEVGEFYQKDVTMPRSYDLTELFAKLILRQAMPLFDIGVDVDKQSSNLILQLTLPQESSLSFGLPSWSALHSHKPRCLKNQLEKISDTFINLNTIYNSYTDCLKDYTIYINSIENVVQELGIFANLSADEYLSEIKDIRFTVEFDVLNQIQLFPSAGQIRDVFIKKEYDVRKVSDLQAQYPIIEWKRLLTDLIGHEVSENSIVQVYFGKNFTEIFNAIAKVDKRKLNNALLAILANDLFLNTVITQELSTREKFCVDISKKLMPDVYASLINSSYANQMHQSYQETMITQLFDIIKKKFCLSLISNASSVWISLNDTTSFKKKCDKINLGLFSVVSEETLNKNYANLNLTGNYQKDLVQLLIHSKLLVYSNEGKEMDSSKIFSYFLDPLSSEPLSLYTSDTIAVPLGLLRKAPEGIPGYLIMARVGFHLAKAITRHFDPTGMKYDIKLTGTSKTTYNELVANTDLNSTRYITFQNHNISFDATIPLSTNEKIRENAAFRLVMDLFNAYGSEQLLPWVSGSYSREKIFFLATAQEFCKKSSILDFMVKIFEDSNLPPILAVENIMSNSPAFSEKFSCAPGSGMNLNEDKYQFPYLQVIEDEDMDYIET